MGRCRLNNNRLVELFRRSRHHLYSPLLGMQALRHWLRTVIIGAGKAIRARQRLPIIGYPQYRPVNQIAIQLRGGTDIKRSQLQVIGYAVHIRPTPIVQTDDFPIPKLTPIVGYLTAKETVYPDIHRLEIHIIHSVGLPVRVPIQTIAAPLHSYVKYDVGGRLSHASNNRQKQD